MADDDEAPDTGALKVDDAAEIPPDEGDAGPHGQVPEKDSPSEVPG